MKSFKKVLAVLLSAILLVSAVSCTPISLSKQWSYKYSDKVLTTQQDIGVYIYAMYQAYNEASTYAQDAKGYKEGESFLDLKIKDEDGKKAVAREWILEEAKKIAVNTIALDYLMADHEATYDEAEMTNAKATAQDTWDVGPQEYVSMGYYMPYKDMLEKHGVSFESFFEASYASSVKQEALFKKLYDKDGDQEVSDEELTKYFKSDYVSYSYITVDMHEDMQDESGNTSSTPMKKKEMQKIENYVKGVADQINGGSIKADKAFKDITKKYSLEDGAAQENIVELFKDTETNNADIAKALKKLKVGEAVQVTVDADGDAPVAYLVVKNDINDSVKDYIENETNRYNVLTNFKKEDLVDYIEKTTEDMLKSKALTENTSVINGYKPDMFYEKPEEEETTESASEEG